MEWLHDRMPLIFEEGAFYYVIPDEPIGLTVFDVGDPKMKQWLDPSIGWTKQVEALLEPFHNSLTIYQGSYPKLPCLWLR